MAYLQDTNLLTRLAQPHAPEHALAVNAIASLQAQGESLFITPQNIIEFWSVATRPSSVNGLDMTPVQVEREVARLEQLFPMLPDASAIYNTWRRLVVSFSVSGRQVHDARLVAVMHVHGISHLLTFNTADFIRYSGIIVVHPKDV